jgi:hypothetical protein
MLRAKPQRRIETQGPIFSAHWRETNFDFTLSAKLSTAGFSPSWRLCGFVRE